MRIRIAAQTKADIVRAGHDETAPRSWSRIQPNDALTAQRASSGQLRRTACEPSTAANNISFVWAAILIRMTTAAFDRSGRTTAAVGGADSTGWVIGPLAAGVVGIYWPGTTGVAVVALFDVRYRLRGLVVPARVRRTGPGSVSLSPHRGAQVGTQEHLGREQRPSISS